MFLILLREGDQYSIRLQYALRLLRYDWSEQSFYGKQMVIAPIPLDEHFEAILLKPRLDLLLLDLGCCIVKR